MAPLTGNLTFVFHGKACAGKSTLMKKLSQSLGGRRLDLLHWVLPLVFRHGNQSVAGSRIKDMYADVLSHLRKVNYDYIETGTEYPQDVLPKLFQNLKQDRRTPVLVHCCLPFSEACRRNEQRHRSVPIAVLEEQNKCEEKGDFRDICESENILVVEIETLASLPDTIVKLTDIIRDLDASSSSRP